ncbi:unnamed protein product, partial [Prorocentrum cordatum]
MAFLKGWAHPALVPAALAERLKRPAMTKTIRWSPCRAPPLRRRCRGRNSSKPLNGATASESRPCLREAPSSGPRPASARTLCSSRPPAAMWTSWQCSWGAARALMCGTPTAAMPLDLDAKQMMSHFDRLQ